MKKPHALLYKIVKIVRYLLQYPLIILNFIGNIYADLLLLIDRKNHSANWQQILQKSIDRYKSKSIIVSINPEKSIKFYTPSLIASFRAKTIFTKEPDTIDWLNENGSKYNCFFDIGANLGLYSIYYAKKFDAKVFSFEPSFKNLELLARNIRLNSLQEHITIISNPLTDKFLVSKYFQGDFKAGAAEASFDNKEYIKEHEIKNKHTIMNKEKIFYNTLGISIDNLIDKNLIDLPKLIKIDVDGNEIEILNGCTNLLEKAKKISILIETRPETEKAVEQKLINYGFKKISSLGDNSIWKN
ncbi:FkbM family methyltransferase [Pelagibacteraceae bacterium]|nr:FkbM family methyltransferase [Pelagibacteraceae bacterium]